MMLEELRRAADARGIATSFTDAADRRHVVSEATLEAVLEAMGPAPAHAAWPPVVVARIGQQLTWTPPEGEPATAEPTRDLGAYGQPGSNAGQFREPGRGADR